MVDNTTYKIVASFSLEIILISTGCLGKDAPSLSDLSFIKNQDGERFKLMTEVAVHWKEIGQVLGLDVGRIAAQHKDDIDQQVRQVFRKWVENASELPNSQYYPLSWHGLNELLVDSELTEIAKNYFAFLDTCKN